MQRKVSPWAGDRQSSPGWVISPGLSIGIGFTDSTAFRRALEPPRGEGEKIQRQNRAVLVEGKGSLRVGRPRMALPFSKAHPIFLAISLYFLRISVSPWGLFTLD